MQCRLKVVTTTGKSYQGPISAFDSDSAIKMRGRMMEALAAPNNVIELTTDEKNWWLIPAREISTVHLAVWDEDAQLPLRGYIDA